jgi:hypothetical protein
MVTGIGEPPQDVWILGIVAMPGVGSVVYESLDPVTLIRRRSAWLVECVDRRIKRIVATQFWFHPQHQRTESGVRLEP